MEAAQEIPDFDYENQGESDAVRMAEDALDGLKRHNDAMDELNGHSAGRRRKSTDMNTDVERIYFV